MEKNDSIELINFKLKHFNQNETEELRLFLYSIYVAILLNRELFHNNNEIKDFCLQLSFPLKDYVFKSRTLVISRFMRKIEKLDELDLQKYLKVAKELLYYTKNKENHSNDTLEKFRRF